MTGERLESILISFTKLLFMQIPTPKVKTAVIDSSLELDKLAEQDPNCCSISLHLFSGVKNRNVSYCQCLILFQQSLLTKVSALIHLLLHV